MTAGVRCDAVMGRATSRVGVLTLSIVAGLAPAQVVIVDNSASFGVDIGCSRTFGGPPCCVVPWVYDEFDFPLPAQGSTDNWHGWGAISWNLGVAAETFHGTATGGSLEGNNGANACELDDGKTGWNYGRGYGDFSLSFSIDQPHQSVGIFSGNAGGIASGISVLPPGRHEVSGQISGTDSFTIDVDLTPLLTGACCLPDQTCVVTLPQNLCISVGGTFCGNNSSCAAESCLHEVCFYVEQGHGFVGFTAATGRHIGVTQLRGLHPSTNNIALSPGAINPSPVQPWDWKICYRIDNADFEAFMNSLKSFEAPGGTPTYSVIAYNCMDFLSDMADAAGVTLPPMTQQLPGLLIPISSPMVFRFFLMLLGDGGTYFGGTVSANGSGGSAFGGEPFDWDYFTTVDEGLADPVTLALTNYWPYIRNDLGTVSLTTSDAVNVDIQNVTAVEAVLALDWGDSQPIEYQKISSSHTYGTAGTYSATVLAITGGGLIDYSMEVLVDDGPARGDVAVVADVPDLPAVTTPNPVPEFFDPIVSLLAPPRLVYQSAKDGTLSTFDPIDDMTTVIGDMGVNIEGLAFAGETLFGTTHDGELYSVNTATGEPTLVGSTGLTSTQGLAFGNGTLYAMADQGLYSLDMTDGSATLLQTGLLRLHGLTVLPFSVLYSGGTLAAGTILGIRPNDGIYGIDPNSLTQTRLRDVPLDIADETIVFDPAGQLLGNNHDRTPPGSGWSFVHLINENDLVFAATPSEVLGSAVLVFPDQCVYDLDADDDVGTSDLLLLLAAWGTTPGGPPDFDGGGVGTSDLLALLAHWGPCPARGRDPARR